jgi:hypothetical protein
VLFCWPPMVSIERLTDWLRTRIPSAVPVSRAGAEAVGEAVCRRPKAVSSATPTTVNLAAASTAQTRRSRTHQVRLWYQKSLQKRAGGVWRVCRARRRLRCMSSSASSPPPRLIGDEFWVLIKPLIPPRPPVVHARCGAWGGEASALGRGAGVDRSVRTRAVCAVLLIRLLHGRGRLLRPWPVPVPPATSAGGADLLLWPRERRDEPNRDGDGRMDQAPRCDR